MAAVSSIPEDSLPPLRASPFSRAKFSYFIPSRICIVFHAEANMFPFTRPTLAASIEGEEGAVFFIFLFYVLTARTFRADRRKAEIVKGTNDQ